MSDKVWMPGMGRLLRRWATVIVLSLAGAAQPAAAQSPASDRIGSIDWYGVRRLSPDSLQAALGVHIGDTANVKTRELERRVLTVPGVAMASASYICCAQSGGVMLFVGVVERGREAGVTTYGAPPAGTVRLPPAVVAASAASDSAFMSAMHRGDMAEDDSQGHALMHDPAARAAQESFIGLAEHYHAELLDVCANSGDAEERAIAAQVLGYAADKRTVIPALVAAVRDPNDDVRNNAVRALAVIAQYGADHREKDIHVPGAAFVSLLNSLIWTDLNKGSFALFAVTGGAHPDTAALALVRRQALHPLIDMARWTDASHALWPFVLLGRAMELSEATVDSAWTRGARELVIGPAEQLAKHQDAAAHR
jgi:HEAT repeat protein